MKNIGHFLKRKNLYKKDFLDKKSLSYVLDKVIKVQYGLRGAKNINLSHFGDRKISLKIKDSNWKNEVFLNKRELINEFNLEMGGEEVEDIFII